MVRTCRKPGVQVDLFDGEPPVARPAWRVIEAARSKHLTGELALPSNPPTNVYLLNGEVYFAERTTDGGIGVRLLVEGVITRKQMSRGSVMVSGAEHLGRLFERDETIDRHAVELCVELMTDDVLTSVSKEMVDSYVMTLYKRHPSGIDRWLPNQSTADAPAVNEDQRAALTDWQPQPARPPERPPVLNGSVAPAAAPTPVVAAPAPVAPPAAPTPVVPTLAPTPTPVAPVLPTLAATPAPVPAPAPAPAPAPIAPPPEPVLLTPDPVRTPERLELDAWPEAPEQPASLPKRAPQTTDTYPAAPAVAASGASPSSIAEEVADAVRRALAAIDSVLVPGDDEPTSPPRPL